MQISIIIPSFNREKLVQRAIKSLIKQSYKKFEIIIIDDASLDNTEIIVNSLIKKYNTFDIKYFYVSDAGTHKENSFLNKISTCFLTNMDVSYGGERYTAYRESETQRKYGGGISGHNGRGTPPQKSQLTLAFQEIEIITQEAIDQGY